MDLGLKGRRAVVTGGSRGIGRAIVELLAQEGVTVGFCGRDAESGRALETSLQTAGGSVTFYQADTGDASARRALAERALAGGAVDILVNNVGGTANPQGGLREWLGVPPEEWNRTYQLNVTGAVDLCQLFVPEMRSRGWGRIINISSVGGLEPGNEVPADYSAAKAALNTMTVSLARALARTGVTANAVSPGPIMTESLQSWIDMVATQQGWPETGDARERRFVSEMFDLSTERLGRPENIAFAVAFLASPNSDYITGTNLRVDGGLSRAAH